MEYTPFKELEFINEFEGIRKRMLIFKSEKRFGKEISTIYKVLGIDSKINSNIYIQRLLKKTMKLSRKAPIFEVWNIKEVKEILSHE